MDNIRLIARLDVKAPNLIKGIQLEGLRKMGDPNAFAKKYYEEGIDEILYIDIVASLYERNSLLEIVEKTTSDVFVPITVGGGLRTISDVTQVLRAGADKVAINTAAIKRPELISKIADKFGSQCMVLSIEAKRTGPDKWEAYYDNGREHSGLDAVEWAQKGETLGAGEIILTSVDQEGTRKGFDVNLVSAVSSVVNIPVVVSGGMGSCDHFETVVKNTSVSAVAIADALHYERYSVVNLREFALNNGIPVREI